MSFFLLMEIPICTFEDFENFFENEANLIGIETAIDLSFETMNDYANFEI